MIASRISDAPTLTGKLRIKSPYEIVLSVYSNGYRDYLMICFTLLYYLYLLNISMSCALHEYAKSKLVKADDHAS